MQDLALYDGQSKQWNNPTQGHTAREMESSSYRLETCEGNVDGPIAS
jgi:hypothetical protein